MKTKPVFLIIGVIFLGLDMTAGFSQDITSREATIAADYRLAILGKQHLFTLEEAREIRKDDLKLAYVFDLEPPGYIVVGASSGLPPVIAYSFTSNFGTMDDDNPLFAVLKADLSKRYTLLTVPGNSLIKRYESTWKTILLDGQESLSNPLFEQWPATGDGWLTTNWTQNPPYNNFCPMDPVTGLRSYAGCPATAMAQIMNFHETTNNMHFNDADDYYHHYAGRNYWIDDDCKSTGFPCFPELNTCLDTLDAHYLSGAGLTNDDKAALTFACGVAARQVYSSQGSGTFGVDQAYDAYLRFGCSTVALLDTTDGDLFDRLKQNIIDTLPAHLAVVNESWSIGHNVVVDGYNTDEYYHLNFGWGGSYNGWYLLPQEIPYELTVIEGVVVDIMKKIPTGILFGETPSLNATFFPNPVSTHLTIKIPGDQSGSQMIIFNLNGQPILRHRITEPQTVVDVSGLNAGIYFVRVVSDDGVMVGKVVKQ